MLGKKNVHAHEEVAQSLRKIPSIGEVIGKTIGFTVTAIWNYITVS